jgi:hypothetical protein
MAIRNRHFWIKITPAPSSAGAIVLGTLICRGSEQSIFDEAAAFVSKRRSNVEGDWTVQISRPDGSSALRSLTVAELIGAS